MSDLTQRTATDDEAKAAADRVLQKHTAMLQKLARVELAERLEYLSTTFGGSRSRRANDLRRAAAYLRACTCSSAGTTPAATPAGDEQ